LRILKTPFEPEQRKTFEFRLSLEPQRYFDLVFGERRRINPDNNFKGRLL
jgi:hypothetical protein